MLIRSFTLSKKHASFTISIEFPKDENYKEVKIEKNEQLVIRNQDINQLLNTERYLDEIARANEGEEIEVFGNEKEESFGEDDDEFSE